MATVGRIRSSRPRGVDRRPARCRAFRGPAADRIGARVEMHRDPAIRAHLSDASWAAGRTLPRWSETASRIARVLKEVALERI